MGARVERCEGEAPGAAELEARLRDEGLSATGWGNGPRELYGWHRHPYHKVLYCVEGAIVFHTRDDGDLALGPGDRLDIDPGTEHAATVGPEGVRCVEAPRPAG